IVKVVRVEGNDAPYSVPEVHRRRQGDRRAHGFTGQGDTGEIEILDNPDDRGPQCGLVVPRARDDVGPSHAWKVQRVHGECMRGMTNWKWSSCVGTVCIRTKGGPTPTRRYRTRAPPLSAT